MKKFAVVQSILNDSYYGLYSGPHCATFSHKVVKICNTRKEAEDYRDAAGFIGFDIQEVDD